MTNRSAIAALAMAVAGLFVMHVASAHRAYQERLALQARVTRIERKPMIHAVFNIPDRKTMDAVLPALRDYGAADIATWKEQK